MLQGVSYVILGKRLVSLFIEDSSLWKESVEYVFANHIGPIDRMKANIRLEG